MRYEREYDEYGYENSWEVHVPALNAYFYYPDLIDAVPFASANPVPEPATWAMMIAGFGIVGMAARRRKHMSQATGA